MTRKPYSSVESRVAMRTYETAAGTTVTSQTAVDGNNGLSEHLSRINKRDIVAGSTMWLFLGKEYERASVAVIDVAKAVASMDPDTFGGYTPVGVRGDNGTDPFMAVVVTSAQEVTQEMVDAAAGELVTRTNDLLESLQSDIRLPS